jgi:hypothetical protein
MKLRQDDNDKHMTLYATFERSARFVEDVRARAGQRPSRFVILSVCGWRCVGAMRCRAHDGRLHSA